MSLRAPRLLPRSMAGLRPPEAWSGPGSSPTDATRPPDTPTPRSGEIRGDRLVWLASAYRSDPWNMREALLRDLTAEPVGPAMHVDARR